MTLSIDGLAVAYAGRPAVHASSLELAPREVVALVGPNGAGKSSLLKALAGLVPQQGTLGWQGRPLPADLRDRARLIAYLPQSPATHWPMCVRDLVALGRLPHRRFGSDATADDAAAVDWAIAEADIATLAARSAAELSGGEHARVQLARALAVRAPILLVDEPVAALDPYHQLKIMQLLARYAAADALVVMVLHDLTLAARFAARVLLMHEGRIVADGPPERVLDEEALRRYYRVVPLLAHHEGQPVVVPWGTL